MNVTLREYSHQFDSVRFFSSAKFDKFLSLMRTEYKNGRRYDTPIMGCISYQRSLEPDSTVGDDVVITLIHTIFETLKDGGPKNDLFQVTMREDCPILVHTKGYDLQAMKSIAPVVISKEKEQSLCELTRDPRGNSLYLHSVSFDAKYYEVAVRRALEVHYDRCMELPTEVPFNQNMPQLVVDIHNNTPMHHQVNAVRCMVQDDGLAMCLPHSETMLAVAELAECKPFRFGEELLIVNIVEPSQQEAKCLYDNLQAYRAFEEDTKKWR
jgi:hypothetical protein